MNPTEIIRYALLAGLLIVGYMLILAWNGDYGSGTGVGSAAAVVPIPSPSVTRRPPPTPEVATRPR
ncbi:MAG: hypothetical protein U5R48_04810 [Gammaproteobacteria bacterium]|nr:hypothetical protein [Gammaproteobacteria bacterium]